MQVINIINTTIIILLYILLQWAGMLVHNFGLDTRLVWTVIKQGNHSNRNENGINPRPQIPSDLL